MKSKVSRLFIAPIFLSLLHEASAVTYIKANNTSNLTTAASYTANSGSPTSAADFVQFDSNYAGAAITNTGALTLGGFIVADTAANVSFGFSSTSTVTVGNGTNTGVQTLIDMSSASNGTNNLTINGANNFFRLNGGSGSNMVFNVATSRTLTINAKMNALGNNKTLRLDGVGNIIFNGAMVSGVNPFGFNVNGANVTLNAANTFSLGSGSFTVTSGQLNLGNDGALGGVTSAKFNGGTLTASGASRSTATAFVLGGNAAIGGAFDLTINGSLTNSAANRTLSVSNSSQTTLAGGIFLSELTGTGRTLTIDGAGNVAVSGVVSNFNGSGSTGGLTYNGSGTLALSNANTFTGVMTVNGSGGLGSVRLDNSLAAQNATVSVGLSNALKFGTGITAATVGGLSGSGNLSLVNTDTNNVTLTVGNNNTTSSYAGVLTSAAALIKSGTGTFTLTGDNSATFSGGMNIGQGTVQLGGVQANGQLGAGSGEVVFTGGTLRLNGAGSSDNATSYGNLTNALSVASGQTGTLTLPRRVTVSSALTGAGTLNVGIDGVRDDFQGNWSAFTGQINLTGAGEFRIVGSQNQIFNNSKLNIGAGVIVHQLFNPPGTGNSTTTQSIGELNGATGSTLAGNPVGGRFVEWSVGGLNTSSTFSGAIVNDAGAAKLTKVGSGTLTLDGASTYTGTTTISAGTLALGAAGSIASPTIINNGNFNVSAVAGYTLGAGQSISGTGTVTGAMTVAGTLSPGNSPGTLSTDSQIWSNGGDYNWQILDATGSAGTGYDTIAITGTLDLSTLTAGNFGINLWSLSSSGPDVSGNASNFNNLLTQSWTILTTSAGITGFEAADFLVNVGANNGAGGFSNALAGGAFSLDQSGSSLVLTFTAVPEPTAGLLVGGLGMLSLLRRRRA